MTQPPAHCSRQLDKAIDKVLESHERKHTGAPVTQVCLDMRHGMLTPHWASPDTPVWLQYGFTGTFDRSEHIGS